MFDVSAIQGLYRYNTWANGRVFDAASSLGPEEFTKDLGSSYRSVRDTLLHIVWAEWIWLQRCSAQRLSKMRRSERALVAR